MSTKADKRNFFSSKATLKQKIQLDNINNPSPSASVNQVDSIKNKQQKKPNISS